MKGYNIILLTIDCLRADHLDCYGYHKKTAPNIARLANRGILFMDVFSAGPYTKASFKTILTGLYPFTKGGYHTIKNVTSLPQMLKKFGYKTFAIPNNVLLNPKSGYSKGFDIYIDPVKKNVSVQKKIARKLGGGKLINILDKYIPIMAKKIRSMFAENPYLTAIDVLRLMIRFIIENRKSRFFIWAHFMDAHHPYRFLPNTYRMLHGKSISKRKVNRVNRMLSHYVHFRKNFRVDLLDEVINLYDTQIRFIDKIIGKLLELLEQLELMESTIIVITSDHGEEFMEHGAFGHSGIRYVSHLYQELLWVPLVIWHPNITKKKVETPVSTADIVPTILAANGIHACNLDGENILGNAKSAARILFSEASLYNYRRGIMRIGPGERIALAVRIRNWKLIYYDDPHKKPELYNLSKDPKEKENLIDVHRDLAQEIIEHIVKKRIKKIKRDLVQQSIYERVCKIFNY